MKEIFTTGLCSPRRGITIYGTGSVQEDDAHYRPRFRRKSGCGFGRDFCITCIKNCTF